MKLDNQQLMSEFYDNIKEAIPGVTFKQIKDICFGPWRFVEDEMESGNLTSIRLKYFGTFQVYRGRAENMLYNLDKRLEENRISLDYYNKYKTMITNYLNKLNEKDISLHSGMV